MPRLALALTLLLAACLTSGAGGTPNEIDGAVRFLEERVAKDPDDFVAQNQLAERYLQKLRETGDLSWLGKARRTAETSLAKMPQPNVGGLSLMARVQLARHRFADSAEYARRMLAQGADESAARALLGDALLELGDLDAARDAFAKLEPDHLPTHVRLARVALLAGNFDDARNHFSRALELAKQLSPAAPETVAWCEVQRGELAFSRGDLDAAEKNYRDALEAFSDYFAAVDHMAELRGARGEYADAIAQYQKLADRLPRPEYWQAIGDLLVLAAKPDDAKPWHDRALAGYNESIDAGEVMFVHHLANFFADVREDAPKAIDYARRDLELRQTSAAHEMLAWALFRSSDFPAAANEMKNALACGGLSAHLAYHAGMIFSAAGDLEHGEKFLRELESINPRYHAFHVHR